MAPDKPALLLKTVVLSLMFLYQCFLVPASLSLYVVNWSCSLTCLRVIVIMFLKVVFLMSALLFMQLNCPLVLLFLVLILAHMCYAYRRFCSHLFLVMSALVKLFCYCLLVCSVVVHSAFIVFYLCHAVFYIYCYLHILQCFKFVSWL